jgi:hypothetical protein
MNYHESPIYLPRGWLAPRRTAVVTPRQPRVCLVARCSLHSISWPRGHMLSRTISQKRRCLVRLYERMHKKMRCCLVACINGCDPSIIWEWHMDPTTIHYISRAWPDSEAQICHIPSACVRAYICVCGCKSL